MSDDTQYVPLSYSGNLETKQVPPSMVGKDRGTRRAAGQRASAGRGRRSRASKPEFPWHLFKKTPVTTPIVAPHIWQVDDAVYVNWDGERVPGVITQSNPSHVLVKVTATRGPVKRGEELTAEPNQLEARRRR